MSTTTHEVWGTGERVVLVHGSLATGPAEWEGQRPLADEGYQLVVPTRRAYATTGAAGGVAQHRWLSPTGTPVSGCSCRP